MLCIMHPVISIIICVCVCVCVVSAELATEMNAHNELKKTWELANQHFIVIQDKLKNEIYRLHQKLERGESARYERES